VWDDLVRRTDDPAEHAKMVERGSAYREYFQLLTHQLAGPVCTLMLADMGADVIKLERVPGGDDSRADTKSYSVSGVSAPFMMVNRNKRGIALDLKSEGGKRVLRRLLERADVLVENYRAGTMERLGFGYKALKRAYPRLVYCSLSGFGRTGPYAGRGGFDLIAQAMAGLMAMTGEGPGRPPVKMGAPVTDITAGILAAMGVAAALYGRERTGRGQMVDTSLYEAGIVHTYWHSTIAFTTGAAPGPLGSAHPLNAPYEAFETEDGWIVIGAANQPNWLRLVEALGEPGLEQDPRFTDNGLRLANVAALRAALAPVFRRRTSRDWLLLLDRAGVPAGPIQKVEEMHQHPQALARGMIAEVVHPVAGRVKTLGLPVKFSATPGRVARAAPLYGQHGREVLRESGLGDREIDRLVADGALVLPGGRVRAARAKGRRR